MYTIWLQLHTIYLREPKGSRITLTPPRRFLSSSLTQDLHLHHLLTGLGAPVRIRNGFQFPLCWEFCYSWLSLHFCLLLSWTQVAVVALSPDWTFRCTPDLTCYLVSSKGALLSAGPITATNLPTFRHCVLLGQGTACAFITLGSLFLFCHRIALLLSIPYLWIINGA